MRSIKKLFNRMSGFTLEKILQQKLTPLRIELAQIAAAGEGGFSREEYNDFIDRLEAVASDPALIKREWPNVFSAIKSGKAERPPHINRPETQLLWAATLLHVQSNLDHFKTLWGSEEDFKTAAGTLMWKQVAGTPYAINELSQNAFFVTECIRRNDTRFGWGAPGSGHQFNPDKNLISVDLLQSLIAGFEHTRGALFREIGRSQLSTRYPQRQREIRDEMIAIRAKYANGKAMSSDDYKKMRLLATEWSLRNRLFEAAEKNPSNRYAAARGSAHQQDYAYSLNHMMVTLSGMGASALQAAWDHAAGQPSQQELLEKQREETIRQLREALDTAGAQIPEEQREMIKQALRELENNAEQRFMNVIRMVARAFYKNNGLFTDTEEGWRAAGVNPDWVRVKGAAKSGVPGGINHPDFKKLAALCAGADGLENMQPKETDRWYGGPWFNKLTDDMAAKRCETIDDIWDLYLAEHVAALMEQAEQQIDEEIEQQKQQQDGDSQDQDGGEGEGEGDGQEQDGQNQQQGQQGQQGQQQGQQGQQQGQGQKGQGQPQGQPSQGDGEGEPQQGQPQQDENSELSPGQEGVNQDGREVDVDMGDGTGEQAMPDVDMPPESPQGDPADASAEGNDADGQDGGEGKTLDELMRELEQQMKEAQDADGQDGDGEGEGDEADGQDGEGQKADGQPGGKPSKQAGDGGKGQTLEEIASGDWKDYPTLVANLQGPIIEVSRMLKKIQDRQLESTIQRSRDLALLPEDNELDRLDRGAHKSLTIKRTTGQKVEENDLKRFQRDQEKKKPVQLDIALMIDGSGSMTSGFHGLNRKATPMEIALLSGVIIMEAAKKIDANVHIMIWGNDDPVVIVRPGDDQKTIGDNIIKARRGLNCGTNMAPSLKKIPEILSEHKTKPGTFSGYTHMIVISDGDINDPGPTRNKLTALYKGSKYFTLDFAVVRQPTPNANNKTQIERLAEGVKSDNPLQKIGIFVEADNNKIPAGIVGLLLDKIRQTRSFTAVPNERKRKLFKRTARRMRNG